MNERFKVGDKVRCIELSENASGLVLGKVSEVTKVLQDGDHIQIDNIEFRWWRKRFELVKDNPVDNPEILSVNDAP